MEDRLLYSDLLASFVNSRGKLRIYWASGWIADGFMGTNGGELAKRGRARGRVLYRHRASSSEAPSTMLLAD